jgi:peptidoglycan/LPS O-acetylase OafA/YrhL
MRAIAIAMVCLSHLTFLKDHPLHHFSSFGPLGVRIFFVLSGMLITRLLLQESNLTGSISLKGFYIRRVVRIFPAMWFYVAVMAALAAVGIITLQRHDIILALTYTLNYFPNRSWYLGHIWSLSVEEQFYLLWPLILCFGARRTAVKVALAAIAMAPILRLSMLLFSPDTPYLAWFPSACDSLATGCLLSLITVGRSSRTISNIVSSRWFLLIPVLVLLVNSRRHVAENSMLVDAKSKMLFIVLDTVGVLVMNLGIALTIQHVVTFPRSLFGKVLNAPPVAWLGTISYSLYLWQMPFLNRDASSWLTRTPVNLLAALIMACISYYLLESPLLRLRKRMGWGEISQKKPSATSVSPEWDGRPLTETSH